jgi:hypothetical protein
MGQLVEQVGRLPPATLHLVLDGVEIMLGRG